MRSLTGVALGLALAALGAVGVAGRAWPIRGFILLVILAAVGATLLAVLELLDRQAGRRWPVPPAWIRVGLALAAALLAGLNVVASLDEGLERAPVRRGALLAAVAFALLADAARADRPPRGPAVTVTLAGLTLVVVGVGLGLGVGSRELGQATALSLTLTALAAGAIGAAAEPLAHRLAGAVAVGLAAGAAGFAWLLVGTFARSNFGDADRVFLALHLVGLALVGAGALLSVRGRRAG